VIITCDLISEKEETIVDAKKWKYKTICYIVLPSGKGTQKEKNE